MVSRDVTRFTIGVSVLDHLCDHVGGQLRVTCIRTCDHPHKRPRASPMNTDDEMKATVIRETQAILPDQLSNLITDHEALNRLHRLLDGPQARAAMADQPPAHGD